MLVIDLILEDGNMWNTSLIKDMFVPEDGKLILSIPLGHLTNEDKLIWHFSKNGLFSVRSAYHLTLRLEELLIPASSSSSTQTLNSWKWLWNLKLPSKIKIFVWRGVQRLVAYSCRFMSKKDTHQNLLLIMW